MGALLVPEPTYAGPNNVIYFRGEQGLTEELSSDKATWLVAFYTAWNPACVNFAPIFAKLSTAYGKRIKICNNLNSEICIIICGILF